MGWVLKGNQERKTVAWSLFGFLGGGAFLGGSLLVDIRFLFIFLMFFLGGPFLGLGFKGETREEDRCLVFVGVQM